MSIWKGLVNLRAGVCCLKGHQQTQLRTGAFRGQGEIEHSGSDFVHHGSPSASPRGDGSNQQREGGEVRGLNGTKSAGGTEPTSVWDGLVLGRARAKPRGRRVPAGDGWKPLKLNSPNGHLPLNTTDSPYVQTNAEHTFTSLGSPIVCGSIRGGRALLVDDLLLKSTMERGCTNGYQYTQCKLKGRVKHLPWTERMLFCAFIRRLS